MNERNETRVVFNMLYASQLIKMGHKVAEIVPNPEKPKLKMWLFYNDATFDEDFNKLRRKE